MEKCNGTLQDRLIKELRLANINDMVGANKYIKEQYISKYNNRFGVEALREGDVHIGNINTKDASMNNLFTKTSAVFQKFQLYKMTLGQNISISKADKQPKESELDSISGLAGLNPADNAFSGRYETMLSREFDGVELSGGQWQRVAIARGLYRDHECIVLDEPTSAIDPLEESRIYRQFAEISQGKTAIIVTHRLGSARLADWILVMKQGRLCEQGTHEQLLAKDGEYSRMYRAQAKWYQ